MNSGQIWQLVTDYEEELQSLPIPDTNKKFQGFQAITFAPSDPQIVYGGFGIWRCATSADADMCGAKTIVSLLLSENGGNSWTRLVGTPLDGLTVSEIVVHPTNPNMAWVATVGGGIFRTEDRGQTWLSINQGLGIYAIMELAGDPVNPDTLYAGTENRGVFKSEDGGATWKSMSIGLDSNEPIYTLVVDPAHPQVIYAGSYRSGVFISEDGGAHWRLINNGLRTRALTSLTITKDGETLYAGTTGEGVFRLSTHDQAYFDSLAPTQTAIPPTVAPTSAVTEPPQDISTPIPSSTPESSTNPTCAGAAIVPLGLVLFVQWRRRARR